MTFLSNLMSFKDTAAETPEVKPAGTRSERTQAIFAKLFATPTTVAQAAAARGKASVADGAEAQEFSEVGMANQIYRYEKKELMARSGVADTPGRPVLWVWVGKK